MNELIGKYLNGYKIVKIENDPFIKGQINLWTDETLIGTFGDRSVVKFFVRNEGNTSKIYQELIDEEKYKLQQRIKKAIDLSDKIYDFIKCKNSNLFYEIEDLLIEQDEILRGEQ